MNSNLVPFTKDSVERARECGRKGGINAGHSRRQRRLVADTIDYVLKKHITNPEQIMQLEEKGISKSKMTYETAVIVSQVVRAIEEKDVNSAKFLFDYRGDMIELEERKKQSVQDEKEQLIQDHNELIEDINLNLQNPPQQRQLEDLENE